MAWATPSANGSAAPSIASTKPSGSTRPVNVLMRSRPARLATRGTQARNTMSAAPAARVASTKARTRSAEPAWFTKHTWAPARAFSAARAGRSS